MACLTWSSQVININIHLCFVCVKVAVKTFNKSIFNCILFLYNNYTLINKLSACLYVHKRPHVGTLDSRSRIIIHFITVRIVFLKINRNIVQNFSISVKGLMKRDINNGNHVVLLSY